MEKVVPKRKLSSDDEMPYMSEGEKERHKEREKQIKLAKHPMVVQSEHVKYSMMDQ